jgi:hypothetical protein
VDLIVPQREESAQQRSRREVAARTAEPLARVQQRTGRW